MVSKIVKWQTSDGSVFDTVVKAKQWEQYFERDCHNNKGNEYILKDGEMECTTCHERHPIDEIHNTHLLIKRDALEDIFGNLFYYINISTSARKQVDLKRFEEYKNKYSRIK